MLKRCGVGVAFLACLVMPARAVGEDANAVRREPVQLTAADGGKSKGVLFLPPGSGQPKTVVLLVHRNLDRSQHFSNVPFAQSGLATFGHASRYLGKPEITLMEALVLDVAAAMKYLKQERHFERIILLGHSGGGQIAAFYQAQAELPPEKRISATPAGDPPDLRKADLPKPDGLVLAVPTSKINLDPSVVLEDDMYSVNPDLDMFNPQNGYDVNTGTASYSADFLTRFRQGQQERLRKLDRTARHYIAEQKFYQALTQTADFQKMTEEQKAYIRRRAASAPWMLIYRTYAEPRQVDLSLEPSDREINREAFATNTLGTAGVLFTPQSFLSTKSDISGNDTFPGVAKPYTVPLLLMYATADQSVFPSDMKAILDAAVSVRSKKFVQIEGAEHVFDPSGKKAGKRDQHEQFVKVIQQWIDETFGK